MKIFNIFILLVALLAVLSPVFVSAQRGRGGRGRGGGGGRGGFGGGRRGGFGGGRGGRGGGRRPASWLQLDHLLHLLLHLGQGGNIAASLLCRALGLGDLISDASQNGRSFAVSVIAMMTRDENLLVNNRLIHRITDIQTQSL
ncbi:hypothetical protein TYRP_000175 [Tyrophagus putrescentiae]|nr:hypothetical protein TYRP_000175 [Tyrophagus putrescentiae]